MTASRYRAVSPLLYLLLAAVCGSLSSCSASPQEHLQGRWYNEELSLRFRPDGSLIYNSTATGLTTGRYFFTGEMRGEAYDEPTPNLTMDLVRGSKVVRSQLEVQFLGSDRLRIHTAADTDRAARTDSEIVVLKRAEDDGNSSVAVAR